MIAQSAKAQRKLAAPVVDDPTPRIANDLVRCCKPCRELATQLDEYPSADALFAELVNAGELARATRLAGHWLSKRKSVWWATLTVWWKLRETGTPAEKLLIDTIVQWVLQPSDELRRTAGQLANQLPKNSSAALVGHAVFWSEGSVAPENCPPVEPPSHLTGHFATSAVIRAVGTDRVAQRQTLRFAAETRYADEPWTIEATAEDK